MNKPPPIHNPPGRSNLYILIFFLLFNNPHLIESCSFVGASGSININQFDDIVHGAEVWSGVVLFDPSGIVSSVEIIGDLPTKILKDEPLEWDDTGTIVRLSAIQPEFGEVLDCTGKDDHRDAGELLVKYDDEREERCTIDIFIKDKNTQAPDFIRSNPDQPIRFEIRKSWDTSVALNWKLEDDIKVADYDHLPENAQVVIISDEEAVVRGTTTVVANPDYYPHRFVFDVQLYLNKVEYGTFTIHASDTVHSTELEVIIDELEENLHPPEFLETKYYLELKQMPVAGEPVTDVKIIAEDKDKNEFTLAVEGPAADYLRVNSPDGELFFIREVPELKGQTVDVIITATENENEDHSTPVVLTITFPRREDPKFTQTFYHDIKEKWEETKQGNIIAGNLALEVNPDWTSRRYEVDPNDLPSFIELDNETGALSFNQDVIENSEEDLGKNRVRVFEVKAIVSGDGGEKRVAVTTVVVGFPMVSDVVTTTEAETTTEAITTPEPCQCTCPDCPETTTDPSETTQYSAGTTPDPTTTPQDCPTPPECVTTPPDSSSTVCDCPTQPEWSTTTPDSSSTPQDCPTPPECVTTPPDSSSTVCDCPTQPECSTTTPDSSSTPQDCPTPPECAATTPDSTSTPQDCPTPPECVTTPPDSSSTPCDCSECSTETPAPQPSTECPTTSDPGESSQPSKSTTTECGECPVTDCSISTDNPPTTLMIPTDNPCPPGCTTPCTEPPPCTTTTTQTSDCPTTCPEPTPCTSTTTQCPVCPGCSTTTENPNSPTPSTCPEPPPCPTTSEPCDSDEKDTTCPPCNEDGDDEDCSTGGLVAATVVTSVLFVASLGAAGYLFWVVRRASINPFSFAQSSPPAPKGPEGDLPSSFMSPKYAPPPPAQPPTFSSLDPQPNRFAGNNVSNGTLPSRRLSLFGEDDPSLGNTFEPTEAGVSNPTFNAEETVAPKSEQVIPPTSTPSSAPLVTSAAPVVPPTSAQPPAKKSNLKNPKEIEPDYEDIPASKTAQSSAPTSGAKAGADQPRSRKVSRVLFAPEAENEYISIDNNNTAADKKGKDGGGSDSEEDYARL